MTFGHRIKIVRSAIGLSQQELAEAISNFVDRKKVTRTAVTQWELGMVQEIESGNLLKMAKVLNVSPEWLRYGVGKQEGDPAFLEGLPMIAPTIIKPHFIFPKD